MKYNFIIPYRDREEHLKIFKERFDGFNLSDDYQFYFIHQTDDKPFNRGALLNIGFLITREICPDALFVFHDIDILPTYWGSIVYDTPIGTARRAIGNSLHLDNLGGICCFYQNNFEQVNGFPNYWGWGVEDVTLIRRVQKNGILVNIQNMAILNSNRCERLDHSRDSKQEFYMHQNDALSLKEIKEKDNSNGLSSLNFEFIKEENIGKNMKMIYVKLLNM